MDDQTTRALNELNLAFYREQAQSFSSKRERPWLGWTRLLTWRAPLRPFGPKKTLFDGDLGAVGDLDRHLSDT